MQARRPARGSRTHTGRRGFVDPTQNRHDYYARADSLPVGGSSVTERYGIDHAGFPESRINRPDASVLGQGPGPIHALYQVPVLRSLAPAPHALPGTGALVSVASVPLAGRVAPNARMTPAHPFRAARRPLRWPVDAALRGEGSSGRHAPGCLASAAAFAPQPAQVTTPALIRLPARHPANGIDAPSMSRQRHQCSIDAVNCGSRGTTNWRQAQQEQREQHASASRTHHRRPTPCFIAVVREISEGPGRVPEGRHGSCRDRRSSRCVT
jgi:hypothetical protein